MGPFYGTYSRSSGNIAADWNVLEHEHEIAKLQQALINGGDELESRRVLLSQQLIKIHQMKEIISGLKQKIQMFEDDGFTDAVLSAVNQNNGMRFKKKFTTQLTNTATFPRNQKKNKECGDDKLRQMRSKVSNWKKLKLFFTCLFGRTGRQRAMEKYWANLEYDPSEDLSMSSASSESLAPDCRLSEQQNIISRLEAELRENKYEREKQTGLLDAQETTLQNLKYVLFGLRRKLNTYEGKSSLDLYSTNDEKIQKEVAVVAEENALLINKLRKLEEQNMSLEKGFREIRRSSQKIIKLYINNSSGIAVGDNNNINIDDMSGENNAVIIDEVKDNIALILKKMTGLSTECHTVKKHLANQTVRSFFLRNDNQEVLIAEAGLNASQFLAENIHVVQVVSFIIASKKQTDGPSN